MSIHLVPGTLCNARARPVAFDSQFLRTSSADTWACVTTGFASELPAPASFAAGARVLELCGSAWISKFPTSRDLQDLDVSFRDKVRAFIAAIHAAGGSVSISATLRPPERAYLMHYSWEVAKGNIAPDKVPGYPGVFIEWDHGNLASSRAAAQAMVNGYQIVYKPSLTSNHSQGKAIDMTIAGHRGRSIVDKSGTAVKIKSDSDLYRVGSSYGVVKLRSDPPHWSADGH